MAIAAAFGILASHACADDNAIAYRLYADGRFAEAAEIFTDPAWKGVALYRSDQYWRAAEAFIRSDDPTSIYNLGNSYAKLGYYELALEAYLNALARQPELSDAALNADIMRKLIAAKNADAKSGMTPPARKIEETPDPEKRDGSGDDQGGERGAAEQRSPNSEEQGKRAAASQPQQAQPGERRSQRAKREDDPDGPTSQQTRSGSSSESDRNNAQAGGGVGDDSLPGQPAVGTRARLEADQATEQWLNRIVDDPARFLKARIALESRRRAASGNSPPEARDAW
ncbi:MAG: tetratricopeptide repeat protein [Rhizobiaceae bacterium]